MLAVLSMLIPGHWNEFIDCQQGKVHITVLPIMYEESRWHLVLELLERAYRLQEFTRECLWNSKYSDYRPFFTTQDEWTIVKYVMEALRTFWYWILWFLKRHTVTLHHAISICKAMVDHMDGIMQASAKEEDSMEGTVVSRHEVSATEAVQILC